MNKNQIEQHLMPSFLRLFSTSIAKFNVTDGADD